MKQEKTPELTPNEDVLLAKLKTSLIRLPNKAATQRIMLSHHDSISLALSARGDPFGRNDFIILSASNEQEVKIPIALINKLPVTIGSGKEADYIVEGRGVSRVHCRLEREEAFVRLVDTNSKNGTFLNRKKITEEYLCEGDEIVIGAVVFFVKRG